MIVLLEYLLDGGPIMIPLVLLSILSVAIIIGDLVLVIWGGYPKTIEIPSMLSGIWTIPVIDMVYPIFRIFMLGLAILIIIALWLFLKKTNLGITIRAGVDNFEMVSTLGINVRRLFTIVFCLSGLLGLIVFRARN